MSEIGETQKSWVMEVMLEVQMLQDMLNEFSTPILGKFLQRVFNIDTIPILLFTKNGLFELSGFYFDKKGQRRECFMTSFFSIDSVNEENNCVTLLLLRPINVYNQPADSVYDVFRLVKTPVCVEVDLDCFCGIQSFHPNLLKKEIIIEPKW
ncbi:CotY/CotZ family spore coat protein [Neobacillus dielmonensis]|uniref:CotY/CotZ family spore coat protein n=1 Tax=Neobacillus dielmonensis TaxID=1347369 RepID=UPI0006949B98|nr:CotY/CotZ family spore coat protein [Neobacillus dielmonensis]